MTTARNRSLAVVTAVSAAGVLAGPAPVQVAGGILLAFALPGLAVTGILFRGRDLSAVERVLLAPALSLAVLIVSGLLMYVLGVDLDRVAWTAATAGVTLLALFAGVLPPRRRTAVDVSDEPSDVSSALAGTAARAAMAPAAIATGSTATGPRKPGSAVSPAGPAGTTVMTVIAVPDADTTTGPGDSADPGTAPDVEDPTGSDDPADGADDNAAPGSTGRRRLLLQVLPLVLALAVLSGASWLSYSSARDGFETTVTTLSAEPPPGMNPAGLRTVRISATGLLAEEGPYRLVVTGDNGGVVAERSVAAATGSWAEALNLPGRQRLTVHLYRAAEATPYRTLLISSQE
jgi:hypothetical protein